MFDLMRRQIDQQMVPLRRLARLDRPPHGWIKTIREAYGMTLAQLAKRLGMSSQALQKLEKTEAKGSITLSSLRRAAEGMNCRLFYILIPETPIEKTLEKQIRKKAASIVERAVHSMRLEDQGTGSEEREHQVLKLIDDIKRRKNISLIWEEETK